MAFVEFEKQYGHGLQPIKTGEMAVGKSGSLGFAGEDFDAVRIATHVKISLDSDAHEISIEPGTTWKVQIAAKGRSRSRFLSCRSALKFLGWSGQHGRIPLNRENGRLVADLTELLVDCSIDDEEFANAP